VLFQRTLECVIVAEEKGALNQEMRSSGMENHRRLLQSFHDEYEKEIHAREMQLDTVLAQARKRWRKLQAELDAALAQIRQLRGSKGPTGNRALEESQYEFESSTRRLDETMSQLGLHPRKLH
jgi:hypothetical protein